MAIVDATAVVEVAGVGAIPIATLLETHPSPAGQRPVVEDGVTGCLVEREDVPGLSRVLGRLLLNDDERAPMESAARRRLLERFTYVSLRDSMKAQLGCRGLQVGERAAA